MCFFSSRRRHTRCSRDWSSDVCSSDLVAVPAERMGDPGDHELPARAARPAARRAPLDHGGGLRRARRDAPRSEEHTSELQSRLQLVCRLLLEKKKSKNMDKKVSALYRVYCVSSLPVPSERRPFC